MAIIDETKRDLLYESNDQGSRPRPRPKPTKKLPPRAPRLLLLEGAAVPCLSRPSFFPSFSPTAGREEKDEEKEEKEEVTEEGDLQQDRRTRYAAKAWSVDKIASSWNEDRRERERRKIDRQGMRYQER